MELMQRWRRNSMLTIVTAVAALLIASNGLRAQDKEPKHKPKQPSPVETSLDDYLTRMRALAGREKYTMGSLWSPDSQISNMAPDYKARQTGDLLIIRLVDNFSATTNGSVQTQRAYNATSGVSSSLTPFTAPTGVLQNLFSPSSTQTLNGKGQAALSSTISLNLSGRIVETLPNNVFVVEAVRDLTVGEDHQTIVLRGLVRYGDIGSDNSVLSSSISNLEAQVRGKGPIADSIHQPNSVIRAILKVVGF